MTGDGRQVMAKAHIAFGKVSFFFMFIIDLESYLVIKNFLSLFIYIGFAVGVHMGYIKNYILILKVGVGWRFLQIYF
jgi:hypothetical protein